MNETTTAESNEAIGQGKPIVIAKGVTKTYDTGKVKVEALRGVDLAVKEGEMIAVMGPSPVPDRGTGTRRRRRAADGRPPGVGRRSAHPDVGRDLPRHP